MEGFVGVRGVIAPRRLRELSRRSDVRGLLQAGSHVGAIALTTAALAYTWGTWWGVPVFLLHGMLINMLYAGEHECYHGTAFKTPWLNDWVARLFGFWMFYPSDYDKWNHFIHHRYTQDWENDPEIQKRPVFESPWQYLWLFTSVPFFTNRIRSIVTHARGHVPDAFFTDRQRRTITVASRWHLIGYAAIAGLSVAFESWWAVMFWIGPLFTLKWVYWLQGLGEHTGLTHEPNTLLNTRTFKTNAFMRWLHWNMVYHTAHHTFTSVPFHALPTLHREIEESYPHPMNQVGYLRCHWEIFRELLRGRTEYDLVADADARYAQAMAATAKGAA